MDPKALNKAEFYGNFDENTNTMEDGLFTIRIREVLLELDELREQKKDKDKLFLFILDGDVDPVWAENLNSVLDDSKLFTLPSGERLSLPMNIKFIMEVDSLEYATQATVSRCGMVYVYNEDITTNIISYLIVKNYKSNIFSKISFTSQIEQILNNLLVHENSIYNKCYNKFTE